MAVFDNSIYFPNLLGSIGGLTIQQNRAGNIIRLKPNNGNFRTVKQSEEIKLFSQLSQQWRALTITEQNDWNTFSLANPHVNLWNQTKSLTGLNYFILCNYYLSTSGLSQITSPPTYTVPTLAASVEVTITTSAITVNLITPSLNIGDIIMIYLTAPLSGKTSLPRKELRFMKYIIYAGVDSFDLTTEWENFFNLPVTATLYDPVNSIFVAASVFDPSTGIPTQFLTAISETGPSYTARTQAFLTATGIVDTTIADALNTMDLALIAAGLDSKMIALYPFVGGTSTTMKFNFMDAQDTDAAFRLTFNGSATFSATGYLPDGSTGYANTHLIPNTHLLLNDGHFSFYGRTVGISNRVNIGANGGGGYSVMSIAFAANRYTQYSGGVNFLPTASSIGFVTANRRDAANEQIAQNGTETNFVNASTGLTTLPFFIGARNQGGTADIFSNSECAFSSFGLSLTTGEQATFYTIVQTFQTALSRQV